MTRNMEIYSGKVKIPQMYEDEGKQAFYATEYLNGRAAIDSGEISVWRIQVLREECLRGYLDGIRDERLFQMAEEEKEVLK